MTEYLCSEQIENKLLNTEVIPTPDYVSDEIVIGAVYKSDFDRFHFDPTTQAEFNSELIWFRITDPQYRYKYVSNKRLGCSFVPLEVLTYKTTFKKTFRLWKSSSSTEHTTQEKLSTSSQHLVKVLCTSPTNTMPEILYIPYRDFIDAYNITDTKNYREYL